MPCWEENEEEDKEQDAEGDTWANCVREMRWEGNVGVGYSPQS